MNCVAFPQEAGRRNTFWEAYICGKEKKTVFFGKKEKRGR